MLEIFIVIFLWLTYQVDLKWPSQRDLKFIYTYFLWKVGWICFRHSSEISFCNLHFASIYCKFVWHVRKNFKKTNCYGFNIGFWNLIHNIRVAIYKYNVKLTSFSIRWVYLLIIFAKTLWSWSFKGKDNFFPPVSYFF